MGKVQSELSLLLGTLGYFQTMAPGIDRHGLVRVSATNVVGHFSTCNSGSQARLRRRRVGQQ